jgi:hypothetical protein
VISDEEAQQQHLLVMIETAQREGRPEREIVAIIDQWRGPGDARKLGGAARPSLVRRLIGRAPSRRAA